MPDDAQLRRINELESEEVRLGQRRQVLTAEILGLHRRIGELSSEPAQSQAGAMALQELTAAITKALDAANAELQNLGGEAQYTITVLKIESVGSLLPSPTGLAFSPARPAAPQGADSARIRLDFGLLASELL